ncbi:hypothetical protein [Sphingomonas arenae]|uniref:hypothetical protein n=1 Tax=Sphingomonas arenae TaxID=2812555 RepID=UPI0019670BCA|nr:hypothetical protein [Sphingomonas arenae]
MRIDRIRPHRPSSTELLIVRLVRRWAAARMLGEDALLGMTRLIAHAGEPPAVAVALHSVLQITEECLGRSLEASCPGTLQLSCDEQAILALISRAPELGAPHGTTDVPHGLPGVLCWAVASLRRMLGDRSPHEAAGSMGCPFRHSPCLGPSPEGLGASAQATTRCSHARQRGPTTG